MQSILLAALALTLPLIAADTPEPVRVCAIAENPEAFEGKVVAVVGRFSFRQTGRAISEEKCAGGQLASFRISFDKKLAPPTPEHLEMDGVAVRKVLKTVQQQTALAKFKFGTPDYDRWAVVYGRVEIARTPPQIVCAGDSVVMFLVDRQ
jgi:hypothetical protein